MIANLKKDARDRDTVLIAGGEFTRQELSEAAHMMECYPALLDALRELVQHVHDEFSCSHPLHETADRARKVIARATSED